MRSVILLNFSLLIIVSTNNLCIDSNLEKTKVIQFQCFVDFHNFFIDSAEFEFHELNLTEIKLVSVVNGRTK